jgi:ribonuclease-3
MKQGWEKKLDALEDRLGYRFRNRDFLLRALTHPSYAHEQAQAREHKNPDTDAWIGHYERLEFLGDAVLDLVISSLLMEKFDRLLEGDLSRLRASLVNFERLAELAIKLKLDKVLLLGRGEKATGGQKKPSILSDAYEAVI